MSLKAFAKGIGSILDLTGVSASTPEETLRRLRPVIRRDAMDDARALRRDFRAVARDLEKLVDERQRKR